MGENEFLNMFTVFVLAIFVGFYVVWSGMGNHPRIFAGIQR